MAKLPIRVPLEALDMWKKLGGIDEATIKRWTKYERPPRLSRCHQGIPTSPYAPILSDAGPSTGHAAGGTKVEFIHKMKCSGESRQLVGTAFGDEAVWATSVERIPGNPQQARLRQMSFDDIIQSREMIIRMRDF